LSHVEVQLPEEHEKGLHEIGLVNFQKLLQLPSPLHLNNWPALLHTSTHVLVPLPHETSEEQLPPEHDMSAGHDEVSV
jgi:hypothetical protein